MTDQFTPDPQRVREIEIDLNPRTVSADDLYLKRMGLFPDDRMVANEIAYAEQTEAYSELGYWTSIADRNYFLTRRPSPVEAFLLPARCAGKLEAMPRPVVAKILEYQEDSEQMENLYDCRKWSAFDLPYLSP